MILIYTTKGDHCLIGYSTAANPKPRSFALTMLGAACGRWLRGFSMNGSTLSGLGQTAWPLRTPATLAAASVACRGGGGMND